MICLPNINELDSTSVSYAGSELTLKSMSLGETGTSGAEILEALSCGDLRDPESTVVSSGFRSCLSGFGTSNAP